MKLAQEKVGLKDGEKLNPDDIFWAMNLVTLMVTAISISEMRDLRLGEVWLVALKFHSPIPVEVTGFDSMKVRFQKLGISALLHGHDCLGPLSQLDWVTMNLKSGQSEFESIKILCSCHACVPCDQLSLCLRMIQGFCLFAYLQQKESWLLQKC